jgi:hypothetical protein
VTAKTLDTRTEPGKGGKTVGKLQKGDYVQIYEIQDGWGRTNGGWIPLDQVGNYEEAGLQQQTNIALPPQMEDEGETDGEETTNEEDENSGDPTDLYGSWYQISDESNGEVWIWLFHFSPKGYTEETLVVHLPDFDAAYPQGGFSYTCTYEGNTIHAVENMPGSEWNSFTFKVSKNTLTLHGSAKYYRGDLDTALSKLEKEYNERISKLIGSWYRIEEPDTNGTVSIWIYEFDKQGNMYENSYSLYLSEIESWKTDWDRHFENIGDTDYYVCDNRIYCEWEGYDPDPKSYKINGSKLTWGNYTYYKGGGDDAAAKAYETYAPKEEPTAPTTEAPAVPTEIPNEAPAA